MVLCTLLGASLSFDHTNGPLASQRGLSPNLMIVVSLLMVLALTARLLGIAVCSLFVTLKYYPKHRQNLLFFSKYVMNIWIYSIPRSTVQATLGGLAYSRHIFLGSEGTNKGFIVMQCTAFAVLLLAPLGALLSKWVGFSLSEQIAKIDKKNKYRPSLYVLI